MKKLFAVIVSIILVISSFSSLAETTCTCNCNQPNEDAPTDEVILTPEQLYSNWFDMAYELIYSQYAQTTWVSSIWYYDPELGKTVYDDMSLLLNDDPLSWTKEEIEIKKKNAGDDNNNTLKHMFMFINSAKPVLESLKASHDLLDIPEKYKAVDDMVISVIDTLLNYRDVVENYIVENKSMQGFDKKAFANPLTYAEMEKAIKVLEFIKDIK